MKDETIAETDSPGAHKHHIVELEAKLVNAALVMKKTKAQHINGQLVPSLTILELENSPEDPT